MLRPDLYRRLRYRLRLAIWEACGSYEEDEWYLLPWLVDPDRAALDVGAHYGSYAGRLARLARRLHCFEPFPAMADRLRHRLPPWAVVHCAAASDRAGTAELFIPLRPDGTPAVAGASLAAENVQLHNRRGLRVPCSLVRLDEIVTEAVGFIKIDVEGYELAVLRGAARILEIDRPILLIESVRFLNPAAPLHIFEFLRPLGYNGLFLYRGRLHGLDSFVPEIHQSVGPTGAPSPDYVWNFIFIPYKQQQPGSLSPPPS